MYDVFNSDQWSRIALDHLKTSCLIMREGVFPSNKRDGYIPRSLLRRVMSGLYLHDQSISNVYELFDAVSVNLDDRDLTENAMPMMKAWLESEVKRFERVLNNANKYLSKYSFDDSRLDATYAFDLTSTYGIPFEFLQEYCIQNSYKFDIDGYNELRHEHQRKSKS